MTFEFATAGRIVFGWGAFEHVPDLTRPFGSKALVVLGREGRRGEAMAANLAAAGVRSVPFRVDGEPTVATVESAVRLARAEGCDVVIAVGGGSVIDAAKAAAGMAAQSGGVLEHLEVVGEGKPLTADPLPFIAVPTTAGTGAEVTRNAVLGVPEKRVKVSLRDPSLLPRVAVVDPELTLSMPPRVTAFTGMDALTQLIEPFVSNASNPIVDGLCREGIARASRSLRTAFRDGSDRGAREDMATASLLGGLALANAKLGAVHGFAGVLGGTHGIPHGAICARLLPFVMTANIAALEARSADDPALLRYRAVARIMTGKSTATALDGVHWVAQLCDDLNIPPLALDPSPSAIDAVVAGAKRASSMKGNPVELPDDVLRRILRGASAV